MSEGERYPLATGEAGARRLRLLHKICGPTTERLLSEIGLTHGMRVLDVGCGIGTVSCWMAQQVGPDGSVIGIDAESAQVDLARRSAFDLALHNVTFQQANAYETGLPRGAFDLVYCRFLLCHLTRPLEALKEMYNLLKPGGTLACEDLDLATTFTEPAFPAFDRMVELLLAFTRKRGTDHSIGRKLHRLFQELGLLDTNIRLLQRAYLRGEEKKAWEYTFLEASPVIIEAGLTTRDEVTEIVGILENISRDERYLVATSRVSQVWGRKRA